MATENRIQIGVATLGEHVRTLDEASFRQLFDTHVDAVYRYCVRRASVPDAEDALVEVFATLWRRRASVRIDNELAWLYGTARKILANQRRSLARRMRLRERLELEPVTVGWDPVQPADRVLEALHRIPKKDREVIRLALWEDLDPPEIGQVLGCSAEAASMRLNRAYTRLSRLLAAQEAAR